MKQRVKAAALGCAVVLGALTIASGRAAAQGLATPSIGTGLSSPTHADAAAVYWNPGMVGFLEGPSILVGGHLLFGDIRYQRVRRATYQREDSLRFTAPIAPESIDPSKTGESPTSHANPLAVAPSFFAALPLDANKRLFVGIGLYAPHAALASFEDGGAQRWSLQEVKIAVVHVNPVVAYRISDALSVGAGASYALGYADITKVQDFASLGEVGRALGGPPLNQTNEFGASATPAVRELSVMSRPIHVRNAIAHGFTFGAGVAVRPTKRLRLGLTYQHSTKMNFNGRFSLDMNDDFFTRDLASQGLRMKPLIEGDATLALTLPRSIYFGAAYELTDRFGLSTMLGYTTWSQIKSFDVAVRSPDLAQPDIGLADTASISIPRRWRDTVAIDLTARYRFTPELGTWLTAGFRSAASPAATLDVASADGDRLVANVGASIALSEVVRFIGEAKVQTILPRDIRSSDLDLGNGRYTLWIFMLGGHLQATFK